MTASTPVMAEDMSLTLSALPLRFSSLGLESLDRLCAPRKRPHFVTARQSLLDNLKPYAPARSYNKQLHE